MRTRKNLSLSYSAELRNCGYISASRNSCTVSAATVNTFEYDTTETPFLVVRERKSFERQDKPFSKFLAMSSIICSVMCNFLPSFSPAAIGQNSLKIDSALDLILCSPKNKMRTRRKIANEERNGKTKMTDKEKKNRIKGKRNKQKIKKKKRCRRSQRKCKKSKET